ncbi:protein translocase subunit SecY [endosymbiont of Sipalinus gigas]|nr:protein translocase subunit SecY [endosymbiont of Sipalinus gigas]
MNKYFNNIFIKDIFKSKSFELLKNKIKYLFYYIIIFRIGSFIPIPCIKINTFLNKNFNNNIFIFKLFNLNSTNYINRISIFSLGITPYISSSMMIQLFNFMYPSLKQDLYKSGLTSNYIYYLSFIISILQSIFFILSLRKIFGVDIFINNNINTYIISILSLVIGTMFLIWLSNQITENSIINGTSLLIFLNIISDIPNYFFKYLNIIFKKNSIVNIIKLILFLFLLILIFYISIFIELSQKKIIINYPINYQYNLINKYSNIFNSGTYIPIKVNISGITPSIFSYNIILFFSILFYWIGNYFNIYLFKILYNSLNENYFLYSLIYIFFIFIFCHIYSFIIFNPKEISNNLKKSSAFINGIRPGLQTELYIYNITKKIVFLESCYISLICSFVKIFFKLINSPFYFNGTSLLIIVVVIIEFINKIQTSLISYKYESIIDKIKNNF